MQINYKGLTKNHVQVAQIMDNNVQKDQIPNCLFQKNREQKQSCGSKNGILHICPTLSTTKGQTI